MVPPLTVRVLLAELLPRPTTTGPFTVSDPPPATVIELLLLVLPTISPAIVAGLVSTGEEPLVPLSMATVVEDCGLIELLQLPEVFQLLPAAPVQLTVEGSR